MKLADRLVKAREKAGMSQVELAARLGVSPGTVAGWETPNSKHRHGIALHRLRQVADVLRLKVSDLVGDMLP